MRNGKNSRPMKLFYLFFRETSNIYLVKTERGRGRTCKTHLQLHRDPILLL